MCSYQDKIIGFILRQYEAFGDTHEQLETCRRILRRLTIESLESEAIKLGYCEL